MACKTKGKKIRSKKAGIEGRGLGRGDGTGPLRRGDRPLSRLYDIELTIEEGSIYL